MRKDSALLSLDQATRFSSSEFNEVRRIGNVLDNGILGVLFESRLSEASRKFVTI